MTVAHHFSTGLATKDEPKPVKRATEVSEPGAVATGSLTQPEWQHPVATAPGSVPKEFCRPLRGLALRRLPLAAFFDSNTVKAERAPTGEALLSNSHTKTHSAFSAGSSTMVATISPSSTSTRNFAPVFHIVVMGSFTFSSM